MNLCQNCNKAPATVHLLDIVPPDGEKRERHLCERCASEEGLTSQQHESINQILNTFIKKASGTKESTDLVCPQCGMTFREFRSQGLLGCPNDYTVFEKVLSPLIERAHEGATHHVGRSPNAGNIAPTKHSRLAKLRRDMKEAIEIEDYETAARLRDQVQELETEIQ